MEKVPGERFNENLGERNEREEVMEIKEEELNEPPEIKDILKYEKDIKRPNPEDFDDIYDPEEIREDIDYLKDKEEWFKDEEKRMGREERKKKKENERRGRAFEVVLYDQIYDGEWMGENAISVLASRYDDVVNGTDMIVEFNMENEPERLVFAIDASTASDMGRIKNKVERNVKKVLNKRRTPVVKYFEAEIPDENLQYYKGGLESVVPVVVGADKGNANELFKDFAEYKDIEEKITEKKKKGEKIPPEFRERKKELQEKLRTHKLQDVFLQEIVEQLRMYNDILEDKDKEMADRCKKLLQVIEEVMKEKRRNDYDENLVPSDQTLINIKEASNNIDVKKIERQIK